MSGTNIQLQPFALTGLGYITENAAAIQAAAAQFGVSSSAIAGAIALEQNNAIQFSTPYTAASLYAGTALALIGLEPNPSAAIAQDYSQAIGSGIDTPIFSDKIGNIALIDMGPAKIRLELAIQLVQGDPTNPAFAPYANNLYQLAVDLNSGSNPALTTSLIGAYMQQGVQFYESHLGPADDPQAGVNAWNALSPDYQNALLVQYYNQGPDFLLSKFQAANSAGQQWSPQLGDGGALYAYPGNADLIGAFLALGGAQQQCFPAGVSIALADGGTKPIEAIVAGDLVLAFDPENPRGALKPARVTRVFRNVTEEWLVLDKGLSVTPGHRFLNERGEFERIDSILARGGRIVGADGAAQCVSAERVVYSQETRRLYEEAEELVAANDGAPAPRPDVKRGWRTYNFEVEGLHTYVANDDFVAEQNAA